MIVLFDGADALFGRRSEVRDSHERCFNFEVSYLLQRMETYRGLAILTTNLKDALDPAILRRIRFVVDLRFPGLTLRAEICRRIFPKETPVEGLNSQALASWKLPGGNIRNVALYTVCMATDEGRSVAMGHLLHAARAE